MKKFILTFFRQKYILASYTIFSNFTVNILQKNELWKNFKYVQTLVLYSRQKYTINFKKKFFQKKMKKIRDKKKCAHNCFKYINNQHHIHKINTIL